MLRAMEAMEKCLTAMAVEIQSLQKHMLRDRSPRLMGEGMERRDTRATSLERGRLPVGKRLCHHG